MTLAMAPTTEDIHTIHQGDPFEFFLSTKDMDNSCETYFFHACSPPIKSAIPEASPAFMRALGTMDNTDNCRLYQTESDDSEEEEDDDKPYITRKAAGSSKMSVSSDSSPSSSSSSTPSSSPRLSPQRTKSNPRPINTTSQSPRKTAVSKTSSKFLSVPSSSLPTNLSERCKTADSTDSGAHNTLAGVALRKGCARKSASFGGYDTVKVHGEKRVSWADERGSNYQLINVRLIRPRLTLSTSDGRSSTPGQSILKTPEN